MPQPVAGATDTPTTQPTVTPTPLPTPTSVPTPTPPSALPAGILPGGQVFFGAQRAGETWQELWWVPGQGDLRLVQAELAPDRWQCAGGDLTRCVIATNTAALQLSLPASGTLVLLDDLSAVAPPSDIVSITQTSALTVSTALSDSLGLRETAAISLTQASTQTLSNVQLSLAPSGTLLAVVGQDGVKIFDLITPSLEAQALLTATTALAWSPDSSLLALAYPTSAAVDTLALWNWREGAMVALANMQDIGGLAWAPDGAKLAFDGRQTPSTPASQGGQSDVFIAFLKSGEIANLTEVFVRNNGLAPGQQIAAWAPRWEADSATVRYILGMVGQLDQQNIARHPLSSRRLKGLEAVPEAGAAGIVPSPDGTIEARVAERDGRQVVQVRRVGGEWSDASPGTFDRVRTLVWAPSELQPDDPNATSGRYLLVVSHNALYTMNIDTGQIGGLAVACPSCTIGQATWLP